jgi:hypothetical protein
MRYHTLSLSLLVASLILLASAAYGYVYRNAGHAVTVDETDIRIEECVCGEEIPVAIHLQNNSRRLARLLGAADC